MAVPSPPPPITELRYICDNTLKKETNLILDSMTPSSAFTTLISMKQGEKMQKIVAKYVYDRFRERDRRVKYNLV